jgi:hypothetical protein
MQLMVLLLVVVMVMVMAMAMPLRACKRRMAATGCRTKPQLFPSAWLGLLNIRVLQGYSVHVSVNYFRKSSIVAAQLARAFALPKFRRLRMSAVQQRS